MSVIPPEIEALIWSIAETGDSQAIAEFESRFPEHRLELLRRVNSVQQLRKAKGKVPALPNGAFIPSPTPSHRLSMGLRAFLGAVGLAGIAFAGYWGAGVVLAPHDVPMQTPRPTGIAKLLSRKADEAVDKPAANPLPEHAVVNPPALPSPTTSTRLPSPSERPLSLHVERASLFTILEGIAAQVNWTIEFAPGTPDPEVRVDYDQVPATQILQDMGKRFGFTAFDEGNGKILVVPARDGDGPVKIGEGSEEGTETPAGDHVGGSIDMPRKTGK